MTISVEGTSENTECKSARAKEEVYVINEPLTYLTCEGEAPGTYITCHDLEVDSTLTIYDVKNWGGPVPGVAPVVEHIVVYEGHSGTSDPPLPPKDQYYEKSNMHLTDKAPYRYLPALDTFDPGEKSAGIDCSLPYS